jgi:hypothetical protein
VAGTDVWVTQPGTSHQDFNPNPIPPDFFAPGSQPFSGIIHFNGDPLGPFGPVDTIVERLAFAPLPGCGSEVTIPIEIVALSLTSVNPITITNNLGPPTQWDVRVTLSSNTPQQPGNMTIRKTHPNGGTFSSTLFVQAKFIFTEVGNPTNQRTLDTGGLMPPVDLGASSGHWMDPAAAGGFSFVTIPAPTPLDHDLNPITPDKLINPTSPNFVAGMRGVGADCENGTMSGWGKALTEEEQAWARHGVLPAQEHPALPDGVEGKACLPDRTCVFTTPSLAAAMGASYGGDNQYCFGDSNDDGRDDNCYPPFPGLAPAGTAGLALLLAVLGLWFVTRRREQSPAA